MNTSETQKTRWYHYKSVWLAIIAVELVGGWFYLNAQVVRGPTPETAAIAGMAFLNAAVPLGEVRLERVSDGPGTNFGRRVELVAYHGSTRVATASVNSFLWLGWQLHTYSVERASDAGG